VVYETWILNVVLDNVVTWLMTNVEHFWQEQWCDTEGAATMIVTAPRF
jgi:hypothetical protein